MSNGLAAVLALLAQLNAPGNDPGPLPAPEASVTCLKTNDSISETNRICTYRCGEGEVTTTLPLAELCPEEIQR